MRRLAERTTLHGAQRLFQEFVVMAYAKILNLELRWVLYNQKSLRADLYQNLVDSVRHNDAIEARAGRRIILPSSKIGSPRHFHKQYQNSIATVRALGKPDLFITVTCNPTWPEIVDELLPGQAASDRPDLVARVFKAKKEAIIDEIKKGLFGRPVAFMWVIEFQKRGLPHAHILIILSADDKPRTADDIDNIISAELPDDEDLRAIISSNMLHRCNATCLDDNGKCTKRFPKQFSQTTHWDADAAYPEYRRRSPADGGLTVVIGEATIDNRFIVPYNPYLMKKYRCHINVEWCSSVSAVKYLYKYVYKGPDRAMAGVEAVQDDQHNEVEHFQNYRYFGASEAAWHIFEFKMSDREPGVEALPVHLENEQTVYFNTGAQAEAIAAGPPRRTPLMAWFAHNEENPTDELRLYPNFPTYYTYQKSTRSWRRRINNQTFPTIGRVYTVSPRTGELFYLRMLLHNDHSLGATSFDDLRKNRQSSTGAPTHYPTFQATCRALGLLQDDREWDDVLTDATNGQMPYQIRDLFVVILEYCQPAEPGQLLEDHYAAMGDDFRRRAEPAILGGPELCAATLNALEQLLLSRGLSLHRCQLPAIDADALTRAREKLQSEQHVANMPSVIRDEMNYNREDEAARAQGSMRQMNAEQLAVFDRVANSIIANEPVFVFVDAPAGTGKTFLFNALLSHVRSQDNAIALAVASSGIASILLEGGRMFHSRFRAPIKPDESSTLFITSQSADADLIRRAQVIIWDEAPMTHRHQLEAMDRTLRDLTGRTTMPFGGKVNLGNFWKQGIKAIFSH